MADCEGVFDEMPGRGRRLCQRKINIAVDLMIGLSTEKNSSGCKRVGRCMCA